jgi:hypothetical protein
MTIEKGYVRVCHNMGYIMHPSSVLNFLYESKHFVVILWYGSFVVISVAVGVGSIDTMVSMGWFFLYVQTIIIGTK